MRLKTQWDKDTKELLLVIRINEQDATESDCPTDHQGTHGLPEFETAPTVAVLLLLHRIFTAKIKKEDLGGSREERQKYINQNKVTTGTIRKI